MWHQRWGGIEASKWRQTMTELEALILKFWVTMILTYSNKYLRSRKVWTTESMDDRTKIWMTESNLSNVSIFKCIEQACKNIRSENFLFQIKVCSSNQLTGRVSILMNYMTMMFSFIFYIPINAKKSPGIPLDVWCTQTAVLLCSTALYQDCCYLLPNFLLCRCKTEFLPIIPKPPTKITWENWSHQR